MLRLYDTAKGEVRELAMREPGKVGLYVCGPTPYDVPHVGHGRMLLVYDVLRRYLEWRGIEVRFISNVTDIEDKIIGRSLAEATPAEAIVERYEDAWFEASGKLDVLPPHEVPHATEYVDRMVDYIAGLIDRGHAYETDDGVYFEVASLPEYGLLARQSLESLRSGARVEVHEEKRSPLDFALWKKAKPDEPHWPSPWGDGRPGWHIECTVMAVDLLGDAFDLHGAGNDLTFPHNENERAQAVAAGYPFAAHWMHHGMVETGGEKMARSGKFDSLTDLLERTDARAYRLLVLRSHYRSPMEVTPTSLADAEAALERIDALARRFPDAAGSEPVKELVDNFVERMDDDLDTPNALAIVFDSVRRANAAADAGDDATARALASTVAELSSAVGLVARASEAVLDDHVTALVAKRDEARRNRDFATSDALRSELEALGWTVEDGPTGTTVRR